MNQDRRDIQSILNNHTCGDTYELADAVEIMADNQERDSESLVRLWWVAAVLFMTLVLFEIASATRSMRLERRIEQLEQRR